jgi:hypothetical protein
MAEFITYGGNDIIDAIYILINMIWELECMTECWKTGIICPILRNGDKLVCEYYRGIKFLNVAYKILSGVLNEKLKEYAEETLGEYQCGFRPNRSTIYQIIIIKQLFEKHIEHGYDLYLLFVNLKQAFDSVNRKKLIEIMNKMGILLNIRRMVQMTMNHTKAKEKIGNKISEIFEFSAGVKQGDGLSAVLFIVA